MLAVVTGVFTNSVMLPLGIKVAIFMQPHSNYIVHLPANVGDVKHYAKLLATISVMDVVVIVIMAHSVVFPLTQEANY